MLIDCPAVTLRNGEAMRIRCLRPPEPAAGSALLAEFGHKGREWVDDIDDRLSGRLQSVSLDTFVYGEIDGQFAGNIWATVPSNTRDLGTLGHVYTPPRHRQKGVCDHLMAALMSLLRQDGVTMVHLATDSEVAARIYERHGFRRCHGLIYRWSATPDADPAAYLALVEPMAIRPVHRGDMPRFEVLYNAPHPWLLHDESLGVYAGGGFESQFLAVIAASQLAHARCLVLENARRQVIGVARLTPHPHPRRAHVGILEWFVHPQAMPAAERLVRAILPPAGEGPFRQIRAWAARSDTSRIEFMRSLGFRECACLAGEIAHGDRCVDLLAFAR